MSEGERITDIRQLLGTPLGDHLIADGRAANMLYESLTRQAERAHPGVREGDKHGDDRQRTEVFVEDTQVKHVSSQRLIEVYSSRRTNPGLGYPSCSRALARKPKTMRDANGYYRRLGVRPDASSQELRKAFATLYRRYHPDSGWAGDSDEFSYIREIARVLLNPRRRDIYDNMDPAQDEQWMDSRVRKKLEEMEGEGTIVMGGARNAQEESMWTSQQRSKQRFAAGEGAFRRVGMDQAPPAAEEAEGMTRAGRRQAMNGAAATNGYDYFAEPHIPGDHELAQIWYRSLVSVAPLFKFTRPLRVWLKSTGEPEWSDMGGIIKIPRSWSPGSAQAFALFTVKIR